MRAAVHFRPRPLQDDAQASKHTAAAWDAGALLCNGAAVHVDVIRDINSKASPEAGVLIEALQRPLLVFAARLQEHLFCVGLHHLQGHHESANVSQSRGLLSLCMMRGRPWQ